jgi:MFS family permease
MSMKSQPSPRSWSSLARVFLPFAFGYFLSYIFRVVNAVIAPSLASDLGLDPSRLGLLTSAYFLTFAAFQLPLGLLLDRYGPRRIEAILLLFAAIGALVFARAESLTGLVLGRALIGLGVSACLMAAFKAFVLWFSPARLPFVNGLQMVSGGLGAMTATAPVAALLAVTDWRGVFTLLALLSLMAAVVIFSVVPERKQKEAAPDLHLQLQGIATVFGSPLFWRIAPWTIASQATFLAIQGLWAGPWLRDVAGLDGPAAARVLLLIAITMVAGFFLFGVVSERLGRRGVPLMTVAAFGMGTFMLVQLLLALVGSRFSAPLWLLFGFFGTASILPYAVLSQSFGPRLAGRANTGLNLLVFVAAFAAQWGIGSVVSLWPGTAAGTYAATGYRAGFALMLALQSAAFLWFLASGIKGRPIVSK